MQYFTFLGLGSENNGYKDVLYSFNDDLNHEVTDCGKFIQVPIVNKFKEKLNSIYIFATQKSVDRNLKELENEINNYNIPIKVILIDKDISFEYFSLKLMQNMEENAEVIIDVTHCFRHIPMKLLFALNYIELTKNVQIKHLFYGMLRENEECLVEDFIHDYQLQKVSTLLYQFDRTLMLNSTEIQPFLEFDESDLKINEFLKDLSSLNEMIEYCEFDRCITSVRKITERCNSILKEEEKYQIIIPIVKSISSKFTTYNQCENEVEKKEELIKIILLHKRYQVAVTFIDQFFREELIRCLVEPDNYKYVFNGDVYSFSQYLISSDGYGIRKASSKLSSNKNKKYLIIVNDNIERLNNLSAILTKTDREIICEFYEQIRNHMNHGTTIDKTHYSFDSILNNMMNIIRKLRKGD